jgi:amino acid adenylation domain-containing protein
VDASVPELVAAQAAADPSRPAVEDGARSFSYAELEAAGTAIASELLNRGVGPEERVAVCLPRSWEAVAAFLGVLRAGAAYVPVNPELPALRQRELVELASARIALTRPAEPGLPREVVRLDAGRLAAGDAGVIDPPPGGDRLAHVLFTSGSTGRPKGVELTHRNLTQLLCGGSDVIPRSDDSVVHAAPLDFDISTLEIWGALVNGARLVVAPAGRPDPSWLGRLIAEAGVSYMVLSPGIFHELVRVAVEDLGGLRLVAVGGDVLPPAAVRGLHERHPDVRLLNIYGPTETSIVASAYEVGELEEGPIPIGRPLPGYALHVLDDEDRPVNDDDVGELWIAGPAVTRGYLGDPERTAERFRPNPFGAGMIYRTGDDVRLLADGDLMFCGRRDRQVKIAGQRAELGEVEHALRAHPGVEAAAVVTSESVAGHKRLVAYVVPTEEPGPGPAELQGYVGDRLPQFMVPSQFHFQPALPLTERGKVDHAALLRAGVERRSSAGQGSSEIAELVGELMAELLELDAVGPDESLFDIGGDSLLAIALVGLLRERVGVELPIDSVFDSPTPAALADVIELAPKDSRPRLTEGPRKGTAPVTFAQRRAWFFEQMNPGSIAYQAQSFLRFTGNLDAGALRAAFGDLVGHHEILRTSFVQGEDEPVQVIHDEVQLPLEELDLRDAGPSAAGKLIRGRLRQRIDPARAPLARWTLIRVGDREWILVLAEHHLIHDGWSFAVLLGQLSEFYSARVEGQSPALASPAVQFQDYARWERKLAAGQPVTEQLDYWKRTLDADAPLIELPTDRPRGARESFVGGSIRRKMESPAVSALAAAGRAEGATLFMSSFAALAVLLHRYTGRDRLQVGSGVANRTEPASRDLLGMILNTVVLRVDLSGDPTVAELLRRVRRVALEAFANADAPFDQVVEALRPARDLSRSPLINVLFSFHDAPRAREHWARLEAKTVQALPNGTAKSDLNIICIPERDEGITFVWEHSDLFEDSTVDRIAGQHLELMTKFASRPEVRISELDVGETGQLLSEHIVRGAPSSYERDGTVIDVFQDRVREDPEAVALDLEGASQSYGELDARSDRIALALVSRGVRPGDRVGAFMPRSLDCYAALLAVLKSGAAYVAMEPDWPPARVALLAADARLRVAITEQRLSARLPADCAPLVLGDLEPEADAELPGGLDPTSAAYVAYTSGSTGKPKGVEVPHRAVVRLVRGQDRLRFGRDQTLLAAAPIAFDASTFEIWGALLNGSRLAVFPPEPPTADAVDEVVRRRRVTTLWLPAGLFHRFVDLELDTLRMVDQLIAGGDVLSPDHVRRALQLMRPDAVLANGYGPTEATTFTCTYRMRGRDALDRSTVPIGRPLANTYVVVVDDQGRSVPPGVAGELWIGGDGVANGYLGDPALTEERFVPDPWTAGRLYRSGDRVRVGADREIEFLGRRDRQLKIRGHRVEPAEIEAALSEHPDVLEIAVEPEADSEGQRRLVAYYVTRSGSLEWRSLRGWLSARLPAAFVPAQWHQLTELPLTPNGKIDRARLSKLIRPERGWRARRGRQRGDTLEERLCEIWRAVLDLDAVGPDDDFFELGGHSLLAVSVFTEIERRLGVELPLATLFSAPTPASLAGQIRADGWRENWAPLVLLREGRSRPPFFCVTAGDGNAVGFGALSRRLHPEQPFYALQPPGLDGRSRVPGSVEEMAERYLREIRRVAPHGPYLLGGRCLGTKVALELAQRLTADGEEVPLLAILDDLEGPAAMDVVLLDGVPYNDVLSKLRARAREDGVALDDVYEPEGAAALIAYAREPVVGRVPRLLHQVWLERPEVREAFPDIANGDGPRLIDWAWEYGRDQFDLPEKLLPPPSTPRLAESSRPQRNATSSPIAERISAAAEWIDVAARGHLPGAKERRDVRLRRVTRRANEAYRARPYPGRITHLASAERAEQLTARRWYDIAQGGVEEHVLNVTHRSMLRVPGVAELASTLDDCIARALR